MISNTLTPIVYPSEEVVAGKTKYHMVRVFKSEEDRVRIGAANDAYAVLQAYLVSSGYRKINRVLS